VLDLEPFPALLVSVDVTGAALTLTGELDHVSAHLLDDVPPVLAHGPVPAWTVDARAVTFCDVGGLRALLGIRAQARLAGKDFRLLGASRCLSRLIALADLPDALVVEPGRPGERAAERLARPPREA
jgi:anti-anti-sigma factor